MPSTVARIAVTGTYSGTTWANVYYVQTDVSAESNAQVSDLITDFKTAYESSGVLGKLSTGYHVTAYRGVVQTSASTGFTAQITSTGAGTTGGAGAPANNSAVLSWLSAAYWRGGKPRTYLAGIPLSAEDTVNGLDNTWKNDLASQAEDFRVAVNAITTTRFDEVTMGFLHWQNDNVWLDPPQFLAFTGVTVHDRIGTQRRRLGQWVV